MANRQALRTWVDITSAEELISALQAALVFLTMRGVDPGVVTIAPLFEGAPYPDEAEVFGVAAVREIPFGSTDEEPFYSIQLMLAGC